MYTVWTYNEQGQNSVSQVKKHHIQTTNQHSSSADLPYSYDPSESMKASTISYGKPFPHLNTTA